MEELDTDETSFTSELSSDAAGNLTIKLVGELDISSAGAFRTTVDQIVASRPERLVFDLSQLSFMDSSGIAVMVYAANHSGEVQLLHPSSIVRRIVEATGLSEILGLDAS